MDYGSDLLLARGSREGGPETCRSHRRAARRPKGGQWSLRISRRRLTLRGYVNERVGVDPLRRRLQAMLAALPLAPTHMLT